MALGVGEAKPTTSQAARAPWRVLLVASALHACNDAFFYVLYPLLPFIAADLNLSYAEIGLVNAAFAGSSAVFQLPAGLLGQRLGEYLLLAIGNGWVAVGLGAMALTTSFPMLLGAAVLAGLGGNVQHPLAASLVARAYESGRRGLAIGTLNFAGDLGKLASPGLVTVLTLTAGWRTTLTALAVFGVIFSAAVAVARRWVQPPTLPRDEHVASGGRRLGLSRRFSMLTLVGMLDATTRQAALTFLPFLLAARGAGLPEIGLLFGVIFAGGAAGKLLCGPLGDRWGAFAVVIATELTTALALCGLAWGPLEAAVVLAAIFGFGLNGTSSVLYAAVAGLVPEGKRGGGYGFYYTATLLAAALAPLGYGLVADTSGLWWSFALMVGLTCAVVPLAFPLRRHLVI
jgi:MFS family permease